MKNIVPITYKIPYPPDRPEAITTIKFDGKEIIILFGERETLTVPLKDSIWYFKKNKKFTIFSPFVFMHWEEISNDIDDFVHELIEKNRWIKVLECDEIVYHKFNPFIVNNIRENYSCNYFYLGGPLPVNKNSLNGYCYDTANGTIYIGNNTIPGRAEASVAYERMKDREPVFIMWAILHDELYISDYISGLDAKISRKDIILNEHLEYDVKKMELTLRRYHAFIRSSFDYSVSPEGKHVLHKILERWLGDETL